MSEHVRRRLSETADTAAAMRMLEVLEDDDDPEPERSPLGDAVEVLELAARLDDMTGGGVTEADVREAVREEVAARADGAGAAGDWRTALIQNADDLEPEVIDSLVSAEQSRPLRDDLLAAVRAAGGVDAETVAAGASLVRQARELLRFPEPQGRGAEAARPKEYDEYREAAGEPAREPTDPAEAMAGRGGGEQAESPPTEDAASPAEERLRDVQAAEAADDPAADGEVSTDE